MSAFVGIDLGTTNSLVAVRNAYGRPEAVPNAEGSNLTPSVIYFGVDPPAVGQEAKEWARLGNDEIASFFKPFMGNPQFKLRFRGKDYDATSLSALVLKKLKADAETRLGEEVDRAVITVPAYFADAQRKAAIAAGEAAGLKVLRIINEPTAAALAYGLQSASANREESVLIYDLGGGTFDVTIARITPEEVRVLATAGDHDLGGKNWDDRIAAHLAEKFAEDTGVDPLDDPVNLNEVLVRSEQAKWTLSERTSARISLQIGSQRRTYELARAEFESMTFPLMERTRRLTEEALADAKMSWRRLSAVLLVGGSTRMPMVRSYVTQMAGAPPRAGVNVDEAVALGAAIQAAMDCGCSASDAVPRFFLAGAKRVQDVMSHSLGAVAVSADESRYVNDIVIGRNLPIPADNVRLFEHDPHGGANDKLEVYLTQGESDSPRDCQILGKYVFSGIEPTAPRVVIEVGMSYDANGVVQVRAAQRDLNKRLSMKVEPVPNDLSWLAAPPSRSQSVDSLGVQEEMTIYLLIDVSSSMAGPPLAEAREAARAFLNQCDLTRMEVGLISFSDQVSLQAEATSNARKITAAIARLNAEGTTNLAEALELAKSRLMDLPRSRYAVILTDGYPDAPEATVREADAAKAEGVQIVVIGTGDADEDYLKRLASAEAGSIFARHGELVRTFGHIAKTLAEGGRGLRKV